MSHSGPSAKEQERAEVARITALVPASLPTTPSYLDLMNHAITLDQNLKELNELKIESSNAKIEQRRAIESVRKHFATVKAGLVQDNGAPPLTTSSEELKKIKAAQRRICFSKSDDQEISTTFTLMWRNLNRYNLEQKIKAREEQESNIQTLTEDFDTTQKQAQQEIEQYKKELGASLNAIDLLEKQLHLSRNLKKYKDNLESRHTMLKEEYFSASLPSMQMVSEIDRELEALKRSTLKHSTTTKDAILRKAADTLRKDVSLTQDPVTDAKLYQKYENELDSVKQKVDELMAITPIEDPQRLQQAITQRSNYIRTLRKINAYQSRLVDYKQRITERTPTTLQEWKAELSSDRNTLRAFASTKRFFEQDLAKSSKLISTEAAQEEKTRFAKREEEIKNLLATRNEAAIARLHQAKEEVQRKFNACESMADAIQAYPTLAMEIANISDFYSELLAFDAEQKQQNIPLPCPTNLERWHDNKDFLKCAVAVRSSDRLNRYSTWVSTQARFEELKNEIKSLATPIQLSNLSQLLSSMEKQHQGLSGLEEHPNLVLERETLLREMKSICDEHTAAVATAAAAAAAEEAAVASAAMKGAASVAARAAVPRLSLTIGPFSKASNTHNTAASTAARATAVTTKTTGTAPVSKTKTSETTRGAGAAAPAAAASTAAATPANAKNSTRPADSNLTSTVSSIGLFDRTVTPPNQQNRAAGANTNNQAGTELAAARGATSRKQDPPQSQSRS